jgi:hypothetical protein
MCCEVVPKGTMERMEVRMPVRVVIKEVRILFTENLRFPGQCSSSQG